MLNAIIKGKFKKEDEAKLISEVEILASRNADTIPKLILSYDSRAAEVSLWKQLENDLDEQKRDLLEEFEQETINKQSSKKSLLAQKRSQAQQPVQQDKKETDPVKPTPDTAQIPQAAQSTGDSKQEPLKAAPASKDEPNQPNIAATSPNPPQNTTSATVGGTSAQPTTNKTGQPAESPPITKPTDAANSNNQAGTQADQKTKPPATGPVGKQDQKDANKTTSLPAAEPNKDAPTKKPADKPKDKPADKPADKPKVATPVPAATNKQDSKQSGTLPKVDAGSTGTQPPVVKQELVPDDF